MHKFSLEHFPKLSCPSKHGAGRHFHKQLLFTEKSICPKIIFSLRVRSVEHKSYASETPILISSKLCLGGSYEEKEEVDTCWRKSPGFFFSFILSCLKKSTIQNPNELGIFYTQALYSGLISDKDNSCFFSSPIQSRKILTHE